MVSESKLSFDEFYRHVYKNVKLFREAFGLPIHTGVKSEADDNYHLALAVEELKELADARSKAAKADAVVDLIYVHMGRLIQMGLYDPNMVPSASYLIRVLYELGTQAYGWDLVALFDEVQRCNMTKLVSDEKVALNEKEILTSKGYEVEIVSKVVANTQYYYFVAANDVNLEGKLVRKGKVLKPSTTEQPDFSTILV